MNVSSGTERLAHPGSLDKGLLNGFVCVLLVDYRVQLYLISIIISLYVICVYSVYDDHFCYSEAGIQFSQICILVCSRLVKDALSAQCSHNVVFLQHPVKIWTQALLLEIFTRYVKTVYFSEPVTGLPKPVFYRLPKGLW